nr:MBL fold metallo-hydrolase [uncultured Carboxylicivirga sp.]
MKTILAILTILLPFNMLSAQDQIQTQNGSFTLHFIGHGTVYIEYKGTFIHIDPWSKLTEYSKLPDADYIFITHEHGDHLDKQAISEIIKGDTKIYAPNVCNAVLSAFDNVEYLNNGENITTTFGNVETVPAYNIIHMRNENKPFHPKGVGNGYILTIDGTTVYIAGDTENIPEMEKLKGIDIAFLPMNLPYTMTPEMVAEATKMIQPKILYPYHYGETDTNKLIDLLKGSKVEIRIRNMQ